MLNYVTENVKFEKWDMEIYTSMRKVGKLTNDLAALAKSNS